MRSSTLRTVSSGFGRARAATATEGAGVIAGPVTKRSFRTTA
jgi:hypothetical protein